MNICHAAGSTGTVTEESGEKLAPGKSLTGYTGKLTFSGTGDDTGTKPTVYYECKESVNDKSLAMAPVAALGAAAAAIAAAAF